MAKMTREERISRFVSRYCEQSEQMCAFSVDEQDRREGPLVEALRTIRDHGTATPVVALMSVQHMAARALAQYDALDAKPEPTVAECQREAIAAWDAYDRTDDKLARLNRALAALKAAVEREERCAGERKGK